MCRRYEPNEQDIMNILAICEDPRQDDYPPQIETREQFNPFGQILKDFADGVISNKMLNDWAKAEEEDRP